MTRIESVDLLGSTLPLVRPYRVCNSRIVLELKCFGIRSSSVHRSVETKLEMTRVWTEIKLEPLISGLGKQILQSPVPPT